MARAEQTNDQIGWNELMNVLMKESLIEKLLEMLEQEAISYCHWKSNTGIDDILTGDTDLDLLVGEGSQERFVELIERLGFVEVFSATNWQYPDIRHYYCYDLQADKWIHIHLHLKLVIGHDLLKNYHLPLENAYLESTRLWRGLRVPQVEFELIIFVIRMVLKRRLVAAGLCDPICLFRAISGGKAFALSSTDRDDFRRLSRESDRDEIVRLLRDHHSVLQLSVSDFDLLYGCVEGEVSHRASLLAGWKLCRALKGRRRIGPVRAGVLAFCRRWYIGINHGAARCGLLGFKKTFRYPSVVAIIGGDGSGKTTNIKGLKTWLGKHFAISSLHVGRPKKGALWYGLLIPLRALTILPLAGFRQFYRAVLYLLLARCRYRTCRQAQKLRRNGKVVLLDRLPLPQLYMMDCPRIRTLATSGMIYEFLARLEERYYRRMRCADTIIVLMLDPSIAKERRPHDDPISLHARSEEIWTMKWRSPRIQLVDASLPLEEVEKRIRVAVWNGLVRRPFVAEVIGVAGTGKSTAVQLIERRTTNVVHLVSYKDSLATSLGVVVRRLPYIGYLMGRGVSVRLLAIVLNIEIMLALLAKHKRARILSSKDVVLDLGPFLQLATVRHAFLSRAPALSSASWLTCLENQARVIVDRVFWLDAKDQILMDRVNGRRQTHRMKGTSLTEFSRFANEYREEFARLLSGYPAEQVQRIDSGCCAAKNVAGIIDSVHS